MKKNRCINLIGVIVVLTFIQPELQSRTSIVAATPRRSGVIATPSSQSLSMKKTPGQVLATRVSPTLSCDEASQPPGDLRTSAEKRQRAAQITSSFENSTLEFQYGYAGNIGNGRGICAGRIGFASGSGGLLQLVAEYTAQHPKNRLAQYLPVLRRGDGFALRRGLSGFEKAFAAEAEKPEFRKAQDDLVDKLYFKPALAAADAVGIKTALGQAIFWDSIIQHGGGGLSGMVAKTKKQMGGNVSGNEEAWLHMFLDVRYRCLFKIAGCQSRVNALRSLVSAGNFSLDPGITWEVYGDRYTISW